jgi:hypothetical protein
MVPGLGYATLPPGKTQCGPRYFSNVAAYRPGGRRSLSSKFTLPPYQIVLRPLYDLNFRSDPTRGMSSTMAVAISIRSNGSRW